MAEFEFQMSLTGVLNLPFSKQGETFIFLFNESEFYHSSFEKKAVTEPYIAHIAQNKWPVHFLLRIV